MRITNQILELQAAQLMEAQATTDHGKAAAHAEVVRLKEVIVRKVLSTWETVVLASTVEASGRKTKTMKRNKMPYLLKWRPLTKNPLEPDQEKIHEDLHDAEFHYSVLRRCRDPRNHVFFPPALCDEKGKLIIPKNCPHCGKPLEKLERITLGAISEDITVDGKNHSKEEPYPYRALWGKDPQPISFGEVDPEYYGYPKSFGRYDTRFVCGKCEKIIEGITDKHFSYS